VWHVGYRVPLGFVSYVVDEYRRLTEGCRYNKMQESSFRSGTVRIASFVIVVILLLAGTATGQDPVIKQGEKLTLNRCIEIALKVHPSIAGGRYSVQEKEALVGQAAAAYYPKLDTSGAFTRNFVEKDTQDRFFPLSPYNENNFAGSLSQMLFDFGRTPTEVKARRLDLDSARLDLEDVGTGVVRGVKVSYFGLLKAKKSRDVVAESVEQFREHLTQAKSLFEAGKKPRYDVTKAEYDLSNTKLNLIDAENELKLSWVRLGNAMGLGAGSISIKGYELDDASPLEDSHTGVDEALEKAYENRPDLRSLVALRESAAASVDRAKKEYFPRLTGNAKYYFLGSEYPLGHGWNAGVQMSMNLFEGFLTNRKVEESVAKKMGVESKIESKKLDILFEVQEAGLNAQKAKEKIATTDLQVKEATENFDISKLRYEAGLADPLEVTDATVALSKAKLARISALYDYRIAQANLEKAMGKR
jgi:outer membrane protein